MDAEELRGGVNALQRVGNTVRRPTGAWTPAVHALLRHLAAAGFAGAPRVYGLDERGREILDFIPGEVRLEAPADDAAVGAAGRLLRAYHDATLGFTPPPDARWYLPAREPAEVICHGDAATYNCVLRDGQPVAFIDFDTAHPGPRVWDAAYTAYRFVPLSAGGDPTAQAARLRAFISGYGEPLRPADVLATAVDRLHALIAHMRARAAAGDAAFAGHLADGHDRSYLADIAHIRGAAATIAASIPG
jgi:Phosphotransferase enzyme family